MTARPAWFQLGAGAGGKDGFDQRFGHVRRQRGALVLECQPSELDRRFIPRQVLPAVHAQVQMMVELGSGGRGQLAGQIVAHEFRELAAGHDEVTSERILPSPVGFFKESTASGAIRPFGCRSVSRVSGRSPAKPSRRAVIQAGMHNLSKTQAIVSWALQLAAAGILLQTLFFKFTASEESVYIFTTLGVEPWGRIATGVIELIASVLLLVPVTAPIGAVLAMGVMAGAILSHLTF